MKFNLFLLLLMTLIAVVLANLQVKIQLKDSTNMFWGLDQNHKIILTTAGTYWQVNSSTTVSNTYQIFPVDTVPGLVVQDNGKGNQYTCAPVIIPPVNSQSVIINNPT